MKTVEIKVINEVGLHARPAAIFVQTANRFKSQIILRNITKNSMPSDAKSILGVLVLGVEKDDIIRLEINGEDEEAAATCLTRLVESDFKTDESANSQNGD